MAVEITTSMGYSPFKMSASVPPVASLEERLTGLEQQFEELRQQVLATRPREKDWRRTVGTFPRDEMTLEAERLGTEWRNRQTAP